MRCQHSTEPTQFWQGMQSWLAQGVRSVRRPAAATIMAVMSAVMLSTAAHAQPSTTSTFATGTNGFVIDSSICGTETASAQGWSIVSVTSDATGCTNRVRLGTSTLSGAPSGGWLRFNSGTGDFDYGDLRAGTSFNLTSIWVSAATGTSVQALDATNTPVGSPVALSDGLNTLSSNTDFDGAYGLRFTQASRGSAAPIGEIIISDIGAAGDTDPPAVSSITVSGSPAANATSMSFVVDFDENANNVSTDDFTVTTASGTATGSVSAVSASSGDPITVTVGSITGTGTIRLDLDGSTNITDDTGNGNGTNGYVAAYTSGSTHTVDRDAPGVPANLDLESASDTGSSSTDNITNDTTPTISGTADANVTVSLLSNVDGSIGSVTSDGSGNWSITASTLTATSHTLTATSTDGVGNTSAASRGLALVIDTTAPSAPSAPDLSAASDSGSSSTDNITHDTTPTLTGTSEASSTVILSSNVDGVVGSATADGSGNWSITASTLTSGSNTLTATATDAAGNTSSASSGLALTLDTTQPTTSEVSAVSSPTSDSTPNYTFTTNETGVFAMGGSCGTSSSTTISSTGNQTITLTDTDNSSALADGTYANCTVTVTDTAGNAASAIAITSFTVDAQRPEIAISSSEGGAVADDNIDLHGAEPAGTAKTVTYTITNSGSDTLNLTSASASNTSNISGSVTVGSFSASTVASGGGTATFTVTYTPASAGGFSFDLDIVSDDTDEANYDIRVSGSATEAPGFSAAFSPDSIAEGGTSTLTFTIDNVGNSFDATALDFTNNLPSGVVIATPPNASTTCTGGTLTATAGSGTISYTGGAVTADSSCTVGADVTASASGSYANTSGDLTSSLGNSGSASDTLTATDATAPTLTAFARNTPSSENTNADTLVFDITFDESVSNVSADDFEITGTTATGVIAGSGDSYTLTVSGGDLAALTGTVGLNLASGQNITDTTGNALGAGEPATDETYTLFSQAPVLASLTRQSPTDEFTNADTLTWDFAFSSISGGFDLDASDFVLTGTTATLSVSRYSTGFTVTASGGDLAGLDGEVLINLVGGVADEYGNVLSTGTPTGANERSYTVDNTAPTVSSIALFPGTSTPTSADAVSWAVTFSENLDTTSISGADFSVTGTTATPTASHVSDDSYEISLAGGDMANLNATVELSLASGVTITDKAGNALVNTTPTGTNNNAIVVQNDVTSPDVTISSGASDPVTGAFSVTFTFTEDVTGFVLGDIVVGNGSASNFAGSGDTYTADISPDDEGTVTVDVAADAAEDGSGNGNTAATQFTIEADFYAPGVTLSTTDSAKTPGNPSSPDYVTAPFTVDVEFTEAVTGLTAGNFVVSNGTAGSLTGSGTNYTVSITPAADGEIDISLGSGAAQDAAGFDSLDSNTLSVTFDGTVPTVSLDAPDTATSGVASVSLVFSESVVDLTVDDISVTNGTASNLTPVTSTFYTFQITPDADGTVTVNFPADGVQDVAGNGNTAAPQVSYESDSAGPTLTISNGGMSAISGNFTATFTFSEDVTDFDQLDISVSGGGVSTFSAVSASVYTALIVPSTDGTLTIDVPAAAAQDAAGNASLAASQFSVETDYEAPTVSLSTSDGTSQTVNFVTNDYVSGSFTVDAEFSEAVTGLELSDFDLLNATASNLSGSGTTYSVTITPDADGDVYVYLGNDAAEDAAGNGSEDSNSLHVINDETGPAPALSYPPSGSVTGDSLELQILWGEAPLGFEFSDLVLSNATLTDLQMIEDNGSVVGALVTLMPDGPGTLTLTLPAGVFTDQLGNANTAMDVYSVEVDTAAPEVTITSSAVEPVTGAFSVTFTFTEDVTGFAVDEIEVGNGTASNLEGSGDTYTADITPSADGAVTVDLDFNAVEDAAGNGNSAATQFSIVSDVSLPSVVISTSAGDPVSGIFTATFTFSETVSGFAASDISVGNGSASNFSGSGDIYTADITPAADGAVTIDVGADAAEDAAGNGNSAATQFSIENDETAPTLVFSTDAAALVSEAFTATATFSENVTGFDAGDLSLTNATVTDFTASSGSVYTMTINPVTNGTVIVGLGSGLANDAAGNGNATSNDLEVAYDGTTPSVSISSTSTGPVSGAFDVLIQFSESVSGFTVDDVTVGNGVISDFVGSSSTGFEMTVTPSADGTVTVDVAADAAADDAGNGNTAADQFSIENDQTGPTVTISTASSDPVSGAFTATFTFSEAVSGFAASDIRVGNGSASNLAGSGGIYTADITPAADGAVTIEVGADAAEDAAGNGNSAATQFSIESDGTAPSVVITSGVDAPVSGSFLVTLTFSEDVTGLELTELLVTNGTAAELTGSGDTYTAEITPESDGTVTIELAADSAQDSAGNGNAASEPFSIETDATAPAVTLSVAEDGVLSGPFTLTVSFAETVTGFALDDLVISNGTASGLDGDGEVFTVLITPDADGDVTIDIAAGAAQDSAGNDSTAAETLVVSSDSTAPVLSIVLPGEETEGAFTARFEFSEDVTGFEASDISVSNGAVSDFASESNQAFTATITPATLGDIVISVADAAAQDAAGNESAAVDAAIEAISRPIEVSVVIDDDVENVTDISAQATITNPGSQEIQFRVEVDVPWIVVDPASGTIPSLGEIELNIAILEAANDLEPGEYTGIISIINETSGAAAAKGPNTRARAEGDSIVVEIPLTVTIEERFGTIQLVSTTPGGVQRDETFVFASTLAAFDGLELTTSQGYAASAIVETRFGAYDVTQALPAGWRLDDISCSGDLDGGSNIDLSTGRVDIDLDPNESIVCTFNNTRDEEAVRLATMRTINNFMVRRADRILSGAPDLTQRLRDRTASSPGSFSADIQGGRSVMSMQTNLAGIRNHVKQSRPQMPGVTLDPDAAGTSFDVWMRADFSALSDTRDGVDVSSDFGLLQFGVDWQLNEASLVGLIFQRDWMDEVTADIAEEAGAIRGARVDGAGWMAGPYAVWEVADGTFVDVMALWGQSDNTVDPLGLYEDEFETTRMMLRANITGEWRSDNWRIRPSASLAHFEETQHAYVDSLGIDIPEQTVSVGRFEAGPEFVYRFERQDGTWWEPGVSLSGVWDYDPADLMDEQGNSVSTGALRADAGITLRGRLPGGVFLSGEASFDGLGEGDFSARSGRLQVSLPF